MENDFNASIDNGVDNGVDNINDHIDIGLDQFKHENGKIFGKFDDAVAFGNAYRELEKMNTRNNQEISALKKANTAPDKYQFTLDDDLVDEFELDENDPEYQMYISTFKELGLSNEKANKLVNAYARNMVERNQVSLEEELRKVGGERGDVIQSLNAFVAKNPDLEDFVRSKVVTAEDAIAMANMIKASRGNMSIPETVVTPNFQPVMSKQDYKDAAFKYQADHKDTIAYNEDEQREYMRLLSLGV